MAEEKNEIIFDIPVTAEINPDSELEKELSKEFQIENGKNCLVCKEENTRSEAEYVIKCSKCQG